MKSISVLTLIYQQCPLSFSSHPRSIYVDIFFFSSCDSIASYLRVDSVKFSDIAIFTYLVLLFFYNFGKCRLGIH